MLKTTGKFEIPYYIYRPENTVELKNKILEVLQDSPGGKILKDMENVYKSDWHTNKDVNYFQKNFVDANTNNYYKILSPYVDEIVTDLTKFNKDSIFRITQGWFHQYYKLNYYDYHEHLGIRWAIIYYAELPIDGPKTEFENFFGNPIKLDVNEGDFLVFSGWLKHRSPPNLSAKRKTIIALNVAEFKK